MMFLYLFYISIHIHNGLEANIIIDSILYGFFFRVS